MEKAREEKLSETAKAEEAEKAATETTTETTTESVTESVTETAENVTKGEETTASSTAGSESAEKAKSKVNESAEKLKAKMDESTQKLKDSMNESTQKLKDSMNESTQKMKDSMNDVTKGAKEEMKKQKEKLSSFWSDFSKEMKKQMNVGTSKPKPAKPAKPTKAAKPAKPAKATKATKATKTATTAKAATAAATDAPKEETTDDANKTVPSVEELEEAMEPEEALDPLSDEALGITAEMTEEEADALRREAKKKVIKAENYQKKKDRLRETLSKTKERAKVKIHGLTWEKVKFFLRDGWNDLKGSNEKPHRVMLDEEEVAAQRNEILKAREEADKLKEDCEKEGKPMKTELMNVDNSNNLWSQVADLLKDAPLIESLLEMSKKVKESKVGETVSYATEDLREKWETSQHPLVYKLSAVYDELFSESDTAKAIREVRRTDPTFLEAALRDEMKESIVPAMLKAWVNADTKTLKLIMNDHAYAQVYSVIKMQQAEGLEMDKHILDIKDVQLQVGDEGCGEV